MSDVLIFLGSLTVLLIWCISSYVLHNLLFFQLLLTQVLFSRCHYPCPFVFWMSALPEPPCAVACNSHLFPPESCMMFRKLLPWLRSQLVDITQQFACPPNRIMNCLQIMRVCSANTISNKGWEDSNGNCQIQKSWGIFKLSMMTAAWGYWCQPQL